MRTIATPEITAGSRRRILATGATSIHVAVVVELTAKSRDSHEVRIGRCHDVRNPQVDPVPLTIWIVAIFVGRPQSIMLDAENDWINQEVYLDELLWITVFQPRAEPADAEHHAVGQQFVRWDALGIRIAGIVTISNDKLHQIGVMHVLVIDGVLMESAYRHRRPVPNDACVLGR